MLKTTLTTKPLDIWDSLGKAKNRLNRVGIELEGGWTSLPPGVELVRDGSIDYRFRLNGVDMISGRDAISAGELVSEPMELQKVPLWIKQNYPQCVNNSCGLHVHMSFQSALYYARLMVPEYQATVVHAVDRWAKGMRFDKEHPIWARLKGSNGFCTAQFHPDIQASKKKKNYGHDDFGNRYTIINFCHGLHGTLECRLLPMFETADEAIVAVKLVIDTTNACLAAKGQGKKEERLQAGINPGGVLREEQVEYARPSVRRSTR